MKILTSEDLSTGLSAYLRLFHNYDDDEYQTGSMRLSVGVPSRPNNVLDTSDVKQ